MCIFFTYILLHERMGNVMTKQLYTALLQAYLSQLKGDYQYVEQSLLQLQPDEQVDDFFIIATWTWLLQRQVGLTPYNKTLTALNYKPYISYLTQEWGNEHSNIWGEKQEDVYLSNISMAYAALMETVNSRQELVLQKNMTEIRDFVFSHLLSGGTALNGVKSRTISTDQTLSVLPYGLFSPEDLIIVEATEKMILNLEEKNGLLPYRGAEEISLAATAMMALYYLEKSEKEKALRYAHSARTNQSQDELAEVLLGIFDYFSSVNKEREQIIHDPLGNENVYASQLTERFPHYPTQQDFLHLACQVVSEKKVAYVSVEVENYSGNWGISQELGPKMENGTVIYQGNLKPLPYHDKYSYYFYTRFQDDSEIFSDHFNLSTWKKESMDKFKLIEEDEEKLCLGFGERYTLTIKVVEEGIKVDIAQGNKTTQPHQCAKYSGSLELKDIQVEVDCKNPCITFSRGEKVILTTHPLFVPIEWKKDNEGTVREFHIHWYTPQEEKFYGFGERYNSLEQRGEVIDCYVYNQYRDQGTRTYIPIPFYMTNQGYGCFVNTPMYTRFDLASELKDKCTMTMEQNQRIRNTSIHFYFKNYKEHVKAFTQETGKPAMVPAWALGPWMSSNNWDRQSIVEEEIEATKKHRIPATVMVLEQWSDEATYYMFNDAMYELKEPGYVYKYEELEFPEWGRWPNPKGMVEKIHEENLKLILWQIPIQKYLNKQKHPLKDQDEAFMIEHGYIVQNEDGSPYRIPENWFTNSLIMDFSHEEGKKWWFDKRQYLLDIGVDGFKTDGGEFVFGKNLRFANGQTGSEMRNQYPNDYIESYYHFAQENNGITFSRAGYTGAQNFPAHWAGDERSTFDAFKRSLVAGLNAGLAGIVFWGWDLAGFNGEIPTAELFMRSSSMAAFCPIMQYHAESKAEFNQDRTPWNIAARTKEDKVIDVYRYFANVRMNLLPYIYQESKKASETGVPLMRALLLEYPEDERVNGLYDEYLFGDSLLVAPVIEEAAISRNVYLPEGKWIDLWSEEIYEGPAYITCVTDVDQIPVFVRMNHAILVNVDQSKQLGSSVGNDISCYHVPLCKIYCDTSFQHKLEDHLGNIVHLCVHVKDKEILVELESDIENLEVEVIGHDKPIRVIV